jgi:hypothetical protein
MNAPSQRFPNGGPEYQTFRRAGFDFVWAGAEPLGNALWYGSNDGRLLTVISDGVTPYEQQMIGSESQSAINGVARFDRWLGISTRNEIGFIDLVESKRQGMIDGTVVQHGAHGISALPSGRFIAALGHGGVMVMKAGSQPKDPVTVLQLGVYTYRAIGFQTDDGGDYLVCAARKDGIGFTRIEPASPSQSLDRMAFEGFDVVDVCPIGNPKMPRAAAVLARDGAVAFFTDVTTDREPLTFRQEVIKGTAYRLVHGQGHMFLLTSIGVFMLYQAASRFIDGQLRKLSRTAVMTLPLEAIDINVAHNQWLLMVMHNEVRGSAIAHLASFVANDLSHMLIEESIPTALAPTWNRPVAKYSTRDLVPAG